MTFTEYAAARQDSILSGEKQIKKNPETYRRGEGARDYDALVEFKQELETLTNKKIDLVIKKFANPIVLYRAQKDLIDVTAN